MRECGSQMTEQELRNLLGCFLFGGDEVDKKIRVLSGGEKARVALAKTIVSKANFLMLDEPTNHLDMHSVELLAEALTKYEGTYIFVSHDRYFISKAANKIWEISDQQIKEFKGNYEEWVAWNSNTNPLPYPRKIGSSGGCRVICNKWMDLRWKFTEEFSCRSKSYPVRVTAHLTDSKERDYCNYMTPTLEIPLTRIGNSRGIRLPAPLIKNWD